MSVGWHEMTGGVSYGIFSSTEVVLPAKEWEYGPYADIYIIFILPNGYNFNNAFVPMAQIVPCSRIFLTFLGLLKILPLP